VPTLQPTCCAHLATLPHRFQRK